MKKNNREIYSVIPYETNGNHDDIFLYNRMDLLYSEDNYAVIKKDVDGNIQLYVHLDRENNCAYAGVWLLNIDAHECEEAFKAIIKNLKVKKVYYKQCLYKIGNATATNHWKIDLPNDSDMLLNRISSRGRNALSRKRKKLSEEVGPCIFEEYTSTSVPTAIVKKYFEQKYNTMGTDYGMSENEYLLNFHVTNAYTLKCNDSILAVLFSCEQTDIVYLENLSYDTDYSKYSCGLLLYTHFLECLINKGKRCIYLGDGNQQYKSRFGSVEQKTFNGEYEIKKLHDYFMKYSGSIKRKVQTWIKKESQ